MEQHQSNLYPSVPLLQTNSKEPNQVFRFNELRRIRDLFLHDIKEFQRLLSKNKKIARRLNITNQSLTVLEIALGSSGLGIIVAGMEASVIFLPIGLAIEGIGLLSLLTSGIISHIHKKYTEKILKYNLLLGLAISKYNTVSNYISNALDDNNISQDEYEIICDVFDKYMLGQEDIKRGLKLQINGTELKEDIQKNLEGIDLPKLKAFLDQQEKKKKLS